MIIQTIYVILLSIYSVNSFCKDIIKISIDEENKSRDGIEESIEKHIQIETSKPKNNLLENKITFSSYSDSLEDYLPVDLSTQTKSDAVKMINPRSNYKLIGRKANPEKHYRYPKTLLKLSDESNSIRAEALNDNIYENRARSRKKQATLLNDAFHSGNMRSAPSNDDIIRDKTRSSTLEDKLYRNKIQFVSQEDNSHHEKMQTALLGRDLFPERLQSGLHEDTLYHEKRHTQGDKLSRKKMPTEPKDTYYHRKMQSVTQTRNDLEFLEPRNSTIKVSDHEDQESKNTEETDDEEHDSLVDYPYSVSVQRKGAHYASGALVGERWVLSTAAEFYNVRETIKLFRMRLGSADCKRGGVVTPLKTITIHPRFTPGKPSFDIAVLRMAQPVPFSSFVKPIGISKVVGKIMSAKFLTTYWPRIVVNKGIMPPSAKERIKFNSMRVSTQSLIPKDRCNRLMAEANFTLDKSCLCLEGLKAHHSDCMPDVGAPVVAEDGLWGITSGWVSPFCPNEPLPTVFTRVTSPDIRTWITNQME